MPEQEKKPLDNIRVLDLSRILAGPYCTQLLGDYGADVIKVERPGQGDDTRAWGPPYVQAKDGKNTESTYYLSANRNKRSIAIDMASEKGANIIRKLAMKSDILVENFKVGGLKKYGLDYDSLKESCPHLIYCSISGFGQTGPNASKPGYDLLVQGFGGIMGLTGDKDGEPMKVGVAVADIMCGMYASTAILAALNHRHLTGEGQYIDIALADTQIAWLANLGTNYLNSNIMPMRHGNQHPNIVPYQVFAVKDGHIIVAVGNDEQFKRFCSLIGQPNLSEQEKFKTNASRVKNREELIPILSGIIKEFYKGDLLTLMEKNTVPGGPINNLQEVFSDPQTIARDMKITMPYSHGRDGHVHLIGNPVKFSKTPVTYRTPPPLCNEHGDEILAQLLNNE